MHDTVTLFRPSDIVSCQNGLSMYSCTATGHTIIDNIPLSMIQCSYTDLSLVPLYFSPFIFASAGKAWVRGYTDLRIILYVVQCDSLGSGIIRRGVRQEKKNTKLLLIWVPFNSYS